MTEGNIATWKIEEGIHWQPDVVRLSLLISTGLQVNPLLPEMFFWKLRQTKLKWMSKLRMTELWLKSWFVDPELSEQNTFLTEVATKRFPKCQSWHKNCGIRGT